MNDSTETGGTPVRLNERTRQAILTQVGLVAGAAGLLTAALYVEYGWDGWALAIPPIALIAILTPLLGFGTEWTIGGGELKSRRWYSRPGCEPATVMPLGPQIEIVHETRYRWRIRPYGPDMSVRPRQARSLTNAMEHAGFRVSEWASRHRLLDLAGRLIQFGVAAGMFVAIALGGPMRPAGFVMFWGSMAAMYSGLAIDYLPWSRHGAPKSPPYWPGREM
jgi:hypothetical protein